MSPSNATFTLSPALRGHLREMILCCNGAGGNALLPRAQFPAANVAFDGDITIE